MGSEKELVGRPIRQMFFQTKMGNGGGSCLRFAGIRF
jgi:hypothetical protein